LTSKTTERFRKAFEALPAHVSPGFVLAYAFEIGEAVHTTVRQAGFSVVRGLMGHSIGRTIHEAPSIPH
jgi:methionine aminopeptidase